MISESLRKHSFWLYGVIVGLSIKTALDIVGAHVVVPPNSYKEIFFEIIRLIAFLLVVIRSYLSSVWFFDKFYEDEPQLSKEKADGYAIDYWFGLTHFLLLFAWAISIDAHRGNNRLFPVLLIIVLLYNSFWCRISRGRETHSEVRKLALLNLAEVVIALATYSTIYLALNGSIEAVSWPMKHKIAEALALLPIMIISLIDIVGLITNRKLIVDAVVSRLKT